MTQFEQEQAAKRLPADRGKKRCGICPYPAHGARP